MRIGKIDFPNEVVQAMKDGTLVVFAGAGVSMGEPTELPDFPELTNQIARGTGEEWTEELRESCETFLGRLKDRGIDVHEIAAERLNQCGLKPNQLHKNITALFSAPSKIKIVTTNYDTMFEESLGECEVKVYNAPILPPGDHVEGILHIHGNVNEPRYMILTDEDFGRAYLLDGQVTRFLRELFATYTILFVGYSYNDTIVRYLTRAMNTESTNRRYILTDNKKEDWGLLGITPIWFKKNAYKELNHGVAELGGICKNGIWGWVDAIESLGDIPPEDEEGRSKIDFYLEDIVLTRWLAKSIHSEEWLWYLDEKGLFKGLFIPDQSFREEDIVWMRWLVKHFLWNGDVFKQVICKYGSDIHEEFARNIIWTILYRGDRLKPALLCEYLTLFERYIVNAHEIAWLIDVVMERKIYSWGWYLFEKLFEVKFGLKQEKDVDFLSSQLPTVKYLCYQSQICGARYQIQNVWKKYEDQFIKNVSICILNFGIQYIVKLCDAYTRLGKTLHGISECLFPEDEKNRLNENPVSILARGIVRAVKQKETEETSYVRGYIDLCLKSEYEVLRIIGLKALRDISTLSGEEKIDCIMGTSDFYTKRAERKQLFYLVAECFDKVSLESKQKVLAMIDKDSNYENEKDTYKIYDWLIWLQRECKEDSEVKRRLEVIQKKYPDFKLRAHPELDVEIRCNYQALSSPISKDEILAMDLENLLKILKEYEDKPWNGKSRIALLQVFADCIKDRYILVNEILKAFTVDAGIDDEVWGWFFEGICESNFVIEEKIELLENLMNQNVAKKYARQMARYFVQAVSSEEVKNDCKQYEDRLFNTLKTMWTDSYEIEDIGDRQEYFCTFGGELARGMLLLLNYQQRKNIPDRYKEIFELVLNDKERNLKIPMIFTLSMELEFLSCCDLEWTERTILPFFTSDDMEEFRAAWRGRCFARGFAEVLRKELSNNFADIIEKMNEVDKKERKMIIEYYAVLMIDGYFADPIQDVIPILLSAIKNERQIFAQAVEDYLNIISNARKVMVWKHWLKEYWQNRIRNIPAQLSDEEKEIMLNWIFVLGDLYSEAIALVIDKMPVRKLPNGFWYYLKRKIQQEKELDATEKLLIFILYSQEEIVHFEVDEIKECVQQIRQRDGDHAELKEALLKRDILLE